MIMYYMYSFVIHMTQVAWSHARRPYVLAMVKVLYNNWGGGGGANLSQAFRKSGALCPMPQLKAASGEYEKGE